MQVRAREQLVFQGDDGLVDVARAQRPTEDEQHEIILGKVEQRPARGAIGLDDRTAHGIARHGDRRGRAQALRRALVGHADGVSPPGQILVCHTRHGILLVQHHGHAGLLGRPGHGNAHVPAKTHDDVGLDVGKPLFRLARGGGDLRHALREGGRMRSVEP